MKFIKTLLSLFAFASFSSAEVVKLEFEDPNPASASIVGYALEYGTTAEMTSSTTVTLAAATPASGAPNIRVISTPDLAAGRYFFTVRAINANQISSVRATPVEHKTLATPLAPIKFKVSFQGTFTVTPVAP